MHGGWDAIIGHWNTTGRSVAPDEPMSIKGMDKYEWLPGRQFVVHHVDVWMGETKVNVIEVIGPCAGDTHDVPMHSFDNEGNHTVMTASRADDGAWIFAGDGIRTTLRFAADGRSMAAAWERRTDEGAWTAWLEMDFVKTT